MSINRHRRIIVDIHDLITNIAAVMIVVIYAYIYFLTTADNALKMCINDTGYMKETQDCLGLNEY